MQIDNKQYNTCHDGIINVRQGIVGNVSHNPQAMRSVHIHKTKMVGIYEQYQGSGMWYM